MHLKLEQAKILLCTLQQSIQCVSNSATSSSAMGVFACYLFLLLTGMRKAYLVDCYAPGPKQVLNILKEVHRRCSCDPQLQDMNFFVREMVVIHMDDVVLLVEYDYWKGVALGTSPHVVDISKDLPVVVTPQETQVLLDCIYSCAIMNISPGVYFMDVKAHEISLPSLKLYPLLTGHYLGYPFCYNFMSNANSTTNALSMQPLRRISFRISIPELICEQPLLGDIDLIEYTCPVIVLEKDSQAMEKLEASIDETKQNIDNMIQEYKLKNSFPSIALYFSDSVVTLHNPVI